MKRISLVLGLAAAGTVLAVAPAQASGPSLCLNYNVTINGTTQAGSQCLPG